MLVLVLPYRIASHRFIPLFFQVEAMAFSTSEAILVKGGGGGGERGKRKQKCRSYINALKWSP